MWNKTKSGDDLSGPRINKWVLFILALPGLVLIGWLYAKLYHDDPSKLSDDLRSVPYLASTVILLPAAYLTFIRQRSLEAKHRVDSDQHRLETTKEDTRKADLKAATDHAKDTDTKREELEKAKEDSRQKELEVANVRADEAAFRARFTEACILLGSAEATVRLGGVSALAGLADEWGRVDDKNTTDDRKAHRQQCINVLCGHLRLPYDPTSGPASTVVTERTWPVGVAGELGPDGITKETRTYQRVLDDKEVRLTIISTITAHLQKDAPVSWKGHNLDFTGATFDGGSFGNAIFSGGKVNFDGAQFTGGTVDFNGTQFTGGTVGFNGARFSGGTVGFKLAQFSGGTVDFNGAQFTGGTVGFNAALFTGGTVGFNGAEFTGGTVDFHGTQFTGGTVGFNRAEFTSGTVGFHGAEFTSGTVGFNWAQFTGGTVDFYWAQFTGSTVGFNRARFTGGTVDFNEANFSGGSVSFNEVTFSDTDVSFDDAEFSGGQVTRDGNEFRGWPGPEVIPSV